ncbi:MAG: cyclase [Acidimicrobiales bacterium]|nr:cyclase [Acidimicrobiales bacterium]
MERVEVDRTFTASANDVWQTIRAIERYPEHMDHVRSIEVVRQEGPVRVARWEVLLRGSVLRWEERGTIDDAARSVSFVQLDGDLSRFEGRWRVHEGTPTRVHLVIDFEIGIPLLASMLNPIATRSLQENLHAMLDDIELRSGAGGRS